MSNEWFGNARSKLSLGDLEIGDVIQTILDRELLINTTIDPKQYSISLIKGTALPSLTHPPEGAVCVQSLDDTIEFKQKLTIICAFASLPGYVGTLW